MLKHSLMGIAVALLCSAQAWAADVSGKWSGEVKLPTGQAVPFIVELHQQGVVVTGKLAGINGAPDVQIMDGKLDNDPIFTLDTSALWAVYFFVILGTLTLPGALMTNSHAVIVVWGVQLVLQTILLFIVLYSRSREEREAYNQALLLAHEVQKLKEKLEE